MYFALFGAPVSIYNLSSTSDMIMKLINFSTQ